MIRAIHFTRDSSRDLELDEVAEVRGRGVGLVWVDVADPSSEDLVTVSRLLPTNGLILDSGPHRRRRPKFQSGTDAVMLIGFGNVDDPADLAEIDVAFGSDWLVTIRRPTGHGMTYDLAPTMRRFVEVREGSTASGLAVFLIVDDLVDGYFDMIEEIEDSLEAIEEKLFDDGDAIGDRDDGGLIQHDLLTLRRGLIVLRRRVVPMRDVLLEMTRVEIAWMDPSSGIALQTVLDHLLRIVDQIDTQRELLGNVVEAHLELQANFMNHVMKKMTSWAAVLVVATLITGIYGMNFEHMPELRWRFGYPLAIVLILSSTGGLWLWFRRKDWL